MSNEYILRSFQLDTPFNSYLDKTFSILEVTFAFSVALKSSLIVFLQAIYMSFSNHLVRSDYIVELDISNSSSVSFIYIKSLRIIDMLLTNLGAYNHRAGTAALFCQSIWAGTPITFFLFDLINYKQLFKILDENRFLCFLKSPEVAKKRLNEAIDVILKQILESNLNYSQFVLNEQEAEVKEEVKAENRFNSENTNKKNLTYEQARLKRSRTIGNGLLIQKLYLNKQQQASSKNVQIRQENDDLIKKSSVIELNRFISKKPALGFVIEESKNLLIEQINYQQEGRLNHDDKANKRRSSLQLRELATQYAYLIRLIGDKSNIWPPNRDEKWRKTSCTNWFYMYLMTSCFTFSIMQFCTIIAIKIGTDSTQDTLDNYSIKHSLRNEIKLQHEIELRLIERFSMIEEHLFVWFAINWFAMPLTLLVSTLFDQARHLYHLRKKFENFIARAHEFKELELTQRSCRHKREFGNIINRLDELTEFEFDNEALELYISFQIFCNELSSTFELARFILNQNVCFVIFSVLPILCYIKHIPSSHYRLFVIFYVCIMLVINGAFYTCGSINASCIKVSKLIWTILASVMQPGTTIGINRNTINQRPIKRSNKNIISSNNDDDKASSATNKIDVVIKDESNNFKDAIEKLKKISSKYNRRTRATISSHTLLLWHKLARNHELLLEKFECQILGILKLQYTSIIKFNFWLVSLVLIFLTMQH